MTEEGGGGPMAGDDNAGDNPRKTGMRLELEDEWRRRKSRHTESLVRTKLATSMERVSTSLGFSSAFLGRAIVKLDGVVLIISDRG
jgi:hypothetical protein